LLFYIEFIFVLQKSRTVIIVAFINGAIFTLFPEIKSMVAVRTPEFSFVARSKGSVKKIGTDFAFNLTSFFAIIEVKIF